MKKIISYILSGVMLLSLTACAATPSPSGIENNTTPPEVTASPSPAPVFPTYPEESADIADLSEYTIVYPSYYDEYRMGEVFLLKDTIKKVTGAELDIISDGEEEREHEIIFASSGRKNGVEESISMFQSGLDYVVGTLNGNIILGGNNFYADMRAVYDFVNNYLGYNDIDNIYSEPQDSISGVNIKIYEKPLITLYACNYAVDPYTEQYAIRDMHDAHFNMTTVYSQWYSKDELLDFIKWCARYEIFVIFLEFSYVDSYTDCPIIWGHLIKDEPQTKDYEMYSQRCTEYVEKYGKYGWKPFVNYFGFYKFWPYLTEHDGLYSEVPVVSFDHYFGNSALCETGHDNMLHVFECARDLAWRKGQDLWTYIESYNITNWGVNTSKSFRYASYISFSFGSLGILCFQYGDASRNHTSEGDWTKGSLINWDYSKNQAWYDAKEANEEILRLAPIYTQYKNIGTYTVNCNPKYSSAYLEDMYPYFGNVVEDINDDSNGSVAYLIGCFDKKSSCGNAFTLLNINNLDDIAYGDSTESTTTKIKINGDNVTFYRDGYVSEVPCDENGYYTLNMKNGSCWFVTVD